MSGEQKKSKAPLVALVLLIIAGVAIMAVLVLGEDFGKGGYPLEYGEIIEEYAGQYALDPYYVCAVIKTESGFDPQAVSRVGARGLMQIMPETGEWIAGKLGKEAYSQEDLFDPATNIEFGCWYLHFLQERFGGNMQLVTAGYNAGHNRVAGWLEDSGVSDGESLTDIPFEETDRYVEKVEQAYQKYRALYPDAF